MRRIAPMIGIFVATLTACAGGAASTPERSYSVGLQVDDSEQRYRYVATGPVDIRIGDEVTFELDNTGALIHDLQVVGPDGDVLGTAAPTAPGDAVSVTVVFEQAGFHRLNCLVDDHLIAHEMQTFVEVTDPSG